MGYMRDKKGVRLDSIEVPSIGDDGALTLRSPSSRTADTTRLRLMSYQKQEAANQYNGGETIWFDLSDPRAKNMLTWRLGVNPATRQIIPVGTTPTDAQMQRIVWAGAHYYAQDQVDDNNPTDVHGHWSIEVPTTEAGLPLRTRFEVLYADPVDKKIGLDKTIIRTTLADFVVRADPAKGGVLRLTGLAQTTPALEFSQSDTGYDTANRRWDVHLTSDSEAAGGQLRFSRFDDTGTRITHLHLDRATGNSTFGYGGGHGARVAARWDAALGFHGFLSKPDAALGSGNVANYAAISQAATDKLMLSFVGAETVARHAVKADGMLEWGDGTNARDVVLYRMSVGRIGTDGDFQATLNLRLGANTTVGGGAGVLAMKDAGTVPASNPTAGLIAYSQGGVFKVRSAAGVIFSTAQQAAIASPTADVTALKTAVDALRTTLQTAGLLAP